MPLRRTGVLTLVLALARLPDASAATPCFSGSSSAIVDRAVARFPAAPELETGALGDSMIAKLVEATCSDAARPWLPTTCSSPGPRGMTELRRRLVADIARLPGVATGHDFEAQIGLAAVDTLLSDGSLETLARSLEGLPCGASASAGGDLPRAGRLLTRVAIRPPHGGSDPSGRIETALVAEGIIKEGEALSSVRRDAAKGLSTALADGRDAVRRTFGAAQASVALVRDAPVALPVGWIEGIVALVDGDVEAAVEAQLAVLKGLGLGDAAAAGRALHTGVRLASARSRDEAVRVLRGQVLGPWSDPFLLDMSLVTPIVSRENITFGGDAALGYAGRMFGVRVHGGAASYNLDDGRTLSLTNKLAGGNDVWLTLGRGDVRFDARFAAELARYGTTLIDRGNGSGANLGREVTFDYRGTLLLGVRYEPNARFAAGFWAGGGLQYEFHNPSNLTTGEPGLTLAQTHAASFVQQSRARVQYLLVPGWLALRLQTEQQRTDKVSAAVGLRADSAGLRLDGNLAKATQIEWRVRLFFDAEMARFFGIVPGLTTGFDFVSFDAKLSAYTVVPVFGIGIRRTAF